MPLYEYHCTKCGEHFEELASDGEKVNCPSCGSAETEQLISACRHMSGGCGCDSGSSSSSSGGGCAGCSGGNCSCCGH